MTGFVSRTVGVAFNLVLPPRCPGCGAVVDSDGRFCGECFGSLELLSPPWCARCGEPFALAYGPDAVCTRCAEQPPAYTAARGALRYVEPAKGIVLRLKHCDATGLADACAAQMARAGWDWLDANAVIVPVPLHVRRLWRRGYNQAALLAKALARRTGTRAVLDGLVRTRATPPSEGLGREERRANVAGAFAVNRPERIAEQRIILVDDVLTSGATADACASALIAAGAASVYALAFARATYGARVAERA